MHYSPAAAPLQFIYPTIYSANRVFYLFILHDYIYICLLRTVTSVDCSFSMETKKNVAKIIKEIKMELSAKF